MNTDDPVTRVRNLGQLWEELNHKQIALLKVNVWRQLNNRPDITMAELPFVTWDAAIAAGLSSWHKAIHFYHLTTYDIRRKRGLVRVEDLN